MLMECRVSSNVRFGRERLFGICPNSPLSLTTLPLCCVVTIDAQSTKTNKRAIFTQIRNFFLSLSSKHFTYCAQFKFTRIQTSFDFHCSLLTMQFLLRSSFVSQSCITDRKTFAFHQTTTLSATVAERTNHEAREFNSKAV